MSFFCKIKILTLLLMISPAVCALPVGPIVCETDTVIDWDILGNLYASGDVFVDVIDNGIVDTAYMMDASVLTLDGGQINQIQSYDETVVNIAGGSISNLIGCGTTTIFVYGSTFNYGFGLLSDTTGTLIGTLANGDTINTTFEANCGADIYLIQTPEPASLLLLTSGGLLLRRRKK